MISRSNHVFCILASFFIVADCFALKALKADESSSKNGAESSSEVVGYDQVRAILRKRCVTCHNPEEMRGDLDLKSFIAIEAGSASGPVVVPGKPGESLLFTTVAHLEEPTMPPNSPRIPARELDVIRRWIEGGLAEKTGESQSVALSSNESLKTNMSPEDSADDVVARDLAASSVENAAPKGVPASGIPALAPVKPVIRPAAIVALDCHPSRDLAAFSGDGQAILMKISTGQLLGAYDFPEGEVTALRFSRDGRLLLVAGGIAGLSGEVRAFEIDSGQQVFHVGDETDTILSVDLSSDGEFVATGGPSRVVRLYRVSDGHQVHTLRKHTDWVTCLRFSPDGLLLASGDRFGGLFVWDPRNGETFHVLRGHTGSVNAMAWDVDAETLISGGEDGVLRVWNMHHGEQTSHWQGEIGPILALARDSRRTVAGGRTGQIATWTHPGERDAVFTSKDQIESIALSASGDCIVSGNALGKVRKLDAKSLDLLVDTQLPTDPAYLQSVMERLDEAETLYAAELEQRAREQLDASNTMDVDAIRSAKSVQGQDETATKLARLVLSTQISRTQNEIDAIRRGLGTSTELEKSLSTSIVELRNSLNSLISQQSALAGHIGQQNHLLEASRMRYEMLQKALVAIERGASEDELLEIMKTSLLDEQGRELKELLDATGKLQERLRSMRTRSPLGISDQAEQAMESLLRELQSSYLEATSPSLFRQ